MWCARVGIQREQRRGETTLRIGLMAEDCPMRSCGSMVWFKQGLESRGETTFVIGLMAGLNKDWNPGNSFPPQSPDQGSALVDGLIIVFCDQVSPARLQLSVLKKDSNPKDLICTIAAAMLRIGRWSGCLFLPGQNLRFV